MKSRPRDQRDLLEAIAAIRHVGRDRVVLAPVRERLLAKGLQDDLDLLLEELAIGLGVQHWVAERLHLAAVIAAPHAEDDAAAREHVRGGEVLGEPQGMPRGHDVERAADLHAPGAMGEVHRQHGNVGDALVAFVLEMVLGQPQRLVAERVGGARQRRGRVEHLEQPRVGITPVVGRHTVETAPLELDVPDVQRGEPRDHRVNEGRHGFAGAA
jgi:hypothetical protein